MGEKHLPQLLIGDNSARDIEGKRQPGSAGREQKKAAR